MSALDEDATRQGFVQAIVELARTLDVALVETAAETSELRRLGCRAGQGFHFARHSSPTKVGEFLGAGACASLDEAISVRDARAEAA